MDERKRYKNARDEEGKIRYKKLRNKVHTKCRKARNFRKRRINANIVKNENSKALTEAEIKSIDG